MKILVPIDGSEFTDRTIDYLASHAATMSKADTFTLIFVSVPIPLRVARGMSDEEVRAYYADEAGEATSAVARRFDKLGWTCRLLTVVGVPSAEICKEATVGRYDLIVMGTHGRGAVGCLLLGSTSQQVLARCKVPILLIR
jgi:nucleotide-binding universal stress UspA family protein